MTAIVWLVVAATWVGFGAASIWLAGVFHRRWRWSRAISALGGAALLPLLLGLATWAWYEQVDPQHDNVGAVVLVAMGGAWIVVAFVGSLISTWLWFVWRRGLE